MEVFLSEFFADYRQLFEQGESLEVIERFYADDIIQHENCDKPFAGKDKLLEMEKANLAGVQSLEQHIASFIVDEQHGMMMGEMKIRFQNLKGQWKQLEEAFVQKWKEGKIVYQRFYYNCISDEEGKV